MPDAKPDKLFEKIFKCTIAAKVKGFSTSELNISDEVSTEPSKSNTNALNHRDFSKVGSKQKLGSELAKGQFHGCCCFQMRCGKQDCLQRLSKKWTRESSRESARRSEYQGSASCHWCSHKSDVGSKCEGVQDIIGRLQNTIINVNIA